MVNIENKRPNNQFYVVWVILSIVSFFSAFVVYILAMNIYNNITGGYIFINGERHIAEDYLLPFILWPAYALLYGYLQSLILRKYFGQLGWWVLATGLSLPFTIFSLDIGRSITAALGLDIYSVWLLIIQFVLFGGVIGVAQWFVLRRHVQHAFWWIPANIIGWGLGASINPLGPLLLILMPAIITSVTLYLLLRPAS